MPHASAASDLDQLGFLLGRAYYSYIGLLQRSLDQAGLSEHVKPGMGSLLFALFREDCRTMTAVAEELQVAKSTMTGMVARMRGAGLVVVETDATDARAVQLKLTPLAHALQPRCQQLAARMESRLTQHLSQHEQQQFYHLLAVVTRTIADALQAAEPVVAAAKKPVARRTQSKKVPT